MDVSEESFNIKKMGFLLILLSSTHVIHKKAITEAIVEKMREVADLSNANIVRNAQCLLSGEKKNKTGSSQYALWVDSNKVQLLNKKMKTCYIFFSTFGG